MADAIKETIHCPSCGRKIGIEIPVMADGVADPQIKTQILEGGFGVYLCLSCEEGIDLTFPFSYHDGSRKLMVELKPEDGEDQELDPKEEKKEQELMQTSSVMENCAMRIAHDKNELREKVLLAEQGRDDRIVELMKPGIFTALFDQVEGNQIMNILYENNEDGECFVVVLDTGDMGTIDFPEEMYQGIQKEYGDLVNTKAPNGTMKEIDNQWASEFVMHFMAKTEK